MRKNLGVIGGDVKFICLLGKFVVSLQQNFIFILMDKLEYIKMVDDEILPSIREKLVSAFESGVEYGKKEMTLDEYLESHNLTRSNVKDFGLRSGLKLIYIDRAMRFEEAQKLGLQFPTYEQASELTFLNYEINSRGQLWVQGPNGYDVKINDDWEEFCIWFADSVIDSTYHVKANLFDKNYKVYTHKTSVYSGKSFKTFFVLPEHLQ